MYKILISFFLLLGIFAGNSDGLTGSYSVTKEMENMYDFVAVIWHIDSEENHQLAGVCSIISEAYCLTVAHVFCNFLNPEKPLPPNYFKSASVKRDFYLTYGGADWTIKNYQTCILEHLIVHPAFDYATLRNDIAVVKSKFLFGLDACGIQLPPTSLCLDDIPWIITGGYGSKAVGQPYEQRMRELFTMVRNHTVCLKRYPSYDPFTQGCAGTLGYGLCTYDGGDPILNLDRTMLIGLGSYTTKNNCGAEFVFIFLPAYADFVCRSTGIIFPN